MGVGGGTSKAFSWILRRVVGVSTALEILFSAVWDLLLAGNVGAVTVCRESLGRLGVSGRVGCMTDSIASAGEIGAR